VATEPKEKQPDISPVPEPAGLVAIARVAKPDAVLSAVVAWARLPIPVGPALLRSITEDDSVPDVVDLAQPIDVAVSAGASRHGGFEPIAAFAVGVSSFDKAKARLGAVHRLVPGSNGDYRVVGIGSAPPQGAKEGRDGDHSEQEEDDDGLGCVLAHAAVGARLVCGEKGALEALAPYLTRTMPREKWPSDVHMELRPGPLRAQLTQFRSTLPYLGQAILGSSSGAAKELIDSAIGEALDVAGDAQKLSLDAKVEPSGLTLSTRLEFRSQTSTLAKALTSVDRADSPPAAFWHLPAETDTALFGRGSDPHLFDHPRELIANLLVEAADAGGMPESERRAVRDLVADRMLPLFTGGVGVYAKGYDQAGVEKAVKARRDVKEDDIPALSEAKRILVEQVVGWHLYQVGEPVAKVGPILKDWSTLWNRPAFSKWARSKAEGAALPQMRIAPALLPGAALPKDSVHLEITIPRDDVDLEPGYPHPSSRKPGPAKPPKKFHRKPVVVHVFAIPDEGATWLAFGMDGKLVAEKALASRSSAPDKNTLGASSAGKDGLMDRSKKMTGGGFFTVRGLAVLTALFAYEERSPFALLSTLPAKGATPLVLDGHPEAPSSAAAGGVSTGEMRVPRSFIEDAVKLVMAAH
jgi:hypothetical protein